VLFDVATHASLLFKAVTHASSSWFHSVVLVGLCWIFLRHS